MSTAEVSEAVPTAGSVIRRVRVETLGRMGRSVGKTEIEQHYLDARIAGVTGTIQCEVYGSDEAAFWVYHDHDGSVAPYWEDELSPI